MNQISVYNRPQRRIDHFAFLSEGQRERARSLQNADNR